MTSSFEIPTTWQAKIIAENRLIVEHSLDDINFGVINYYFYPQERFQSPNEVFSARLSASGNLKRV